MIMSGAIYLGVAECANAANAAKEVALAKRASGNGRQSSTVSVSGNTAVVEDVVGSCGGVGGGHERWLGYAGYAGSGGHEEEERLEEEWRPSSICESAWPGTAHKPRGSSRIPSCLVGRIAGEGISLGGGWKKLVRRGRTYITYARGSTPRLYKSQYAKAVQ
jgi:hypothetical protein